MSKLKILDLFCGAGGLSLGFEMAGFKVIGAVDFNKQAIETHEENFKNSINICGDIKEISNDEIINMFDGVDVIVGGPPCQGFSAANQWQSEEEKREKNLLFYEYMRFVEILKPKIFLIENVRQILTNNNSYATKEIEKISSELGYEISNNVLDASEYGVPQKRIRAFIVGVRKEFGVRFDFNSIGKKEKATVYDAISDLYNYENNNKLDLSKSDYQKQMRSNSKDLIVNHEIKYPIEKVQNRIKHVPQGGNWRDVPLELWDTIRDNRHSSAYRRLKEDDISITIDTGHMNYFHPIFNRVPTVRESARIQSFPDNFIFKGTKTAQFMQVGNAVPPLLAKQIALALFDFINKFDINRSLIDKNESYKIIDLFCGAGGFSFGFETEGFESVLALDKWEQAIKSYNHNHKNKVAIHMDIKDYTDEMLQKLNDIHHVDGIIGGPPCQGFSMVGTRDSNDTRNSLYLEYVRFVSKVKPKFFILENVKGLLNLEKGFFKNDIINRFTKLGYNVNFKVLKASEYGIPQNRERVFFVGLRKDYFDNLFFEFPTGDKNNFVSTRDALSDLPSLDLGESQYKYKSDPLNNYQKKMRENANGDISNNDITKHEKKTIDIISMVPDGGNIKDLSEEYYKVRNYNAAFKRMNSKLPSSTIDCGHRNYFHYSENRIPTVREVARLQSFPDRFFFTGTKTSQYTQVGNAVPPILGEIFAREIKKLMKKIK